MVNKGLVASQSSRRESIYFYLFTWSWQAPPVALSSVLMATCEFHAVLAEVWGHGRGHSVGEVGRVSLHLLVQNHSVYGVLMMLDSLQFGSIFYFVFKHSNTNPVLGRICRFQGSLHICMMFSPNICMRGFRRAASQFSPKQVLRVLEMSTSAHGSQQPHAALQHLKCGSLDYVT